VKSIYTDPELLERLRLAAQRPMTREEVREQKISWVLGNLPFDSAVTRDEVEAAIVRHEGYAA
jgi:hypothetical protein